MRTTINLDDDVTAAVAGLRRERGIGVSEAVNQLARQGLAAGQRTRPRVQLEAASLNLRVDVSNVAEALDTAEGRLP